MQCNNFKIILGYEQEGSESMIQLFILFIILGICIILLGVSLMALIIKSIMKINLNNKYKWIVILLHWLGLIFAAWLIMEGLNTAWSSVDVLIALLKI